MIHLCEGLKEVHDDCLTRPMATSARRESRMLGRDKPTSHKIIQAHKCSTDQRTSEFAPSGSVVDNESVTWQMLAMKMLTHNNVDANTDHG